MDNSSRVTYIEIPVVDVQVSIVDNRVLVWDNILVFVARGRARSINILALTTQQLKVF